jgi:hypothetical protein
VMGAQRAEDLLVPQVRGKCVTQKQVLRPLRGHEDDSD